MKRVAVLSFHYTDNPGSALQAYALKTTIEGLGYECSLLNYQKKGAKMSAYRMYLPYLKKRFKFLGPVVWVSFLPFLEARLMVYKRFQKKHLNITEKVSDRERLKTIANQYDCFVAGSDQIWNRHNVKVDDTYFLDFVKDTKKKIAYAPSFGVAALSTREQEMNRDLLQAFGALSVREQEGREIIRRVSGQEAPVVLDPTLLLDKNAWKSFSISPKERGYILLYLRKISPSIARFAEKLASMTGLEIVQIVGLRKRANLGTMIRSPGPQHWVGLIENAKYVITNSFHGVAFSINYNKQFFVEPMSGSQEETNSRIYSILRQFDLTERIIDDQGDCIQQQDIDYEKLNQLLDEKRAFSMEFLQKALLEGSACSRECPIHRRI